jgi:CHASE2 domain-containing sensor protein
MAEEALHEKWIRGVVITTTCLAVMTAIAAARGGACGIKTQLLTAIESSKWAYYQAKSIKQNLAESQKNAFEVEVLGVVNTDQKTLYENKLKISTDEISRYNTEKNQIKKEAEDAAALNNRVAKKGNFFSGSVVFFQIAIMLSSVGALLKRKFMWIIGLFFGAIAIVLLGYGLFLQPLLF